MKFISPGLVSDAIITLKEIKETPCQDIQSLKIIHVAHGVNFDTVLSFLDQCKWITYKDLSNFVISEEAERILSLFNGKDINSDLWQIILGSYILTCQPAWAGRIPYGRQEAFIFMSPDEKKCFIESGLMTSPPDEVTVKWWDFISEKIREKYNISHETTGRHGEKLTFDYEEKRVGEAPIWKSIETNLAGYDIISKTHKNSNEQLLIEVKSSYKPLNEAKMILSRHEWNVAINTPQTSKYMFYVWKLDDCGANILARLSVDDILPNIPTEQGEGSWKELEIPYSSFFEKFTPF